MNVSEPATSHLVGTRVVITRPRHQQAELVNALVELGAEPIDVPMIDIIEIPAGVADLRRTLADADDLAWLIVTSPNGARVISILHEEGCPLPPTAALGAATAEAVGFAVEFVSPRATAASMVDAFPAGSGKVVVVQGDIADDTLSSGLAGKGWNVERCNVYRTVNTEPDDAVIEEASGADAVILASGSAARNWARLVADNFNGAVVAIGPITATVAQEAGLVVSAVAEEPTVAGLIDALGSALSP
jgi:uroporphyrinogen-III synthase